MWESLCGQRAGLSEDSACVGKEGRGAGLEEGAEQQPGGVRSGLLRMCLGAGQSLCRFCGARRRNGCRCGRFEPDLGAVHIGTDAPRPDARLDEPPSLACDRGPPECAVVQGRRADLYLGGELPLRRRFDCWLPVAPASACWSSLLLPA